MTIENIPELFKSNDIIYHYCSMSTALEYILSDLQLRLSPREESADPLESIKPIYTTAIVTTPDEFEFLQNLRKETLNDIIKIRKDLITKNEQVRQVCFCKNEIKYFDDNLPDSYGFFKPRMWNQYADDFKGVCLAFSQKSMLEEKGFHSKEFVFDNGENGIHYQKTYRFSERRSKRVLSPYEFKKLGKQKFKDAHFQNLKKTWFEKHQDYKDENEYRICTLVEEKYDYISVEKSLKGLIFSKNHVSDFCSDALIRLAEKLDIHAVSLIWNSHPVDTKIENYPTDIYNELQNSSN